MGNKFDCLKKIFEIIFRNYTCYMSESIPEIIRRGVTCDVRYAMWQSENTQKGISTEMNEMGANGCFSYA